VKLALAVILWVMAAFFTSGSLLLGASVPMAEHRRTRALFATAAAIAVVFAVVAILSGVELTR
jgi:hypothetical protein